MKSWGGMGKVGVELDVDIYLRWISLVISFSISLVIT